MGSSESILNNANEPVDVWYQLDGGLPPAGGYGAMTLQPGQTSPDKYFALSLLHEVCVKYKQKNGVVINNEVLPTDDSVCTNKFSPGGTGQHVTYSIADIIAEAQSSRASVAQAAEAKLAAKVESVEAHAAQEVDAAKSEAAQAQSAEQTAEAKAAQEVDAAKSEKTRAEAAQEASAEAAKESETAEAEAAQQVAQVRDATQKSLLVTPQNKKQNKKSSKAAQETAQHPPIYNGNPQYCLPASIGNQYCASSNDLIVALPVVLLLAVIVFKKLKKCFRSKSVEHEPEGVDSEICMSKVIEDAAFVLPKQGILPNFVHHNPWENLQHMNFHDSFNYMHELLSYLSPGERLLSLTNADPRIKANAALVDLCNVFLDRGVAKWMAPNRDKGFLHFFASLESLGGAPWREHARKQATRILSNMGRSPDSRSPSECIIRENLIAFGTPTEQWTNTIRAMLFDLPGWAGMFQRMETHPSEAPANAKVQLTDFAAVQSILARSSIEYLAEKSGWDTKTSLGSFLSQAPLKRHEGLMDEPWQNPSGVAFKDQNLKQRESLEAEYEYTTMRAIGGRTQVAPGTEFQTRPVLQVYTCIDERECSFRRHLEEATGNPDEIETFGVPGFFNFAIRYLGAEADSRHSEILAPEGNKPEPTMVEERDGDVVYNQRRQLFARLELAWERASFSPLGSLWLAALSPFTFVGLAFMSIFPTTKRRLMENFWASTVGEPKRDYKLPLTHKEAALRLAQTFQNIGVKDRFSPIVMLLGHGSRTVNNPFDAAHNCGACGGREGGPNARLMARCANDPEIRAILAKDYGIMIPDDTHFIGGYHDTTSELVDLFDVGTVPPKGQHHFRKAMEILYKGRGNNALERCSKFMLASNCRTTKQALTHVHTRSTDLGEARPELGHATNASVIIGRRELTKGLFLARRAFLPSYDPFNDDDRGTNLERVITPALIVCSGISLEYLFSTTDGGAGTKVCMNVVGNHGVMQGVSGDLLVGLPTQMTEMHSPLRALYVVDAPVARVQAVLSRNDTIRNIVVNDWVRLFVRDPNTNIIYRQEKGGYVPVDYNTTYGIGKTAKTFVPFTHQANYVTALTRYEAFVATLSAMVMLLSCVGSIYFFGAQAMHERGSVIAMAGTALALCALAFQRRYLHGEFMFDRFCILAALLLTGFNMVATAPTLANVSVGWNLIGFTSAFLIGSYNDRPTVKQHTTYVFFIYRISDVALLLAAAFNDTLLQSATTEKDGIHASLVAGGLLVAALLKTSQFPVNNLFARSMEGTSPGSAIGDASLAAHIGIVMLSGTMPLWFGFNWARYVLSVIGLITVCTSGLVAKIRSDRKGSIGYATSASIGLLYIILAMGYADIALFLAFGHAALRMVQILRAVNHPLEYHHLTGALEHKTEPKVVPEGWFKLGWRLNRMSTDMSLPPLLHMFRSICKFKPLELGKYSQWLLTTVLIVLAGMPFTPLTQFNDQVLMNLLHTSAYKAVALMIFFIMSSTCLFSWVMTSVLTAGRFEHSAGSIEKYKGGNPNFGVSNNPEFVKSQDESLSSPSESASNSLTEPLLKTDSPLPHVHNPQMGA